MKKVKLALIFLSLIAFKTSHSQSLEVGLQGMYNTCGVVNPNTYGSLAGDYQTKYSSEYGILGTFKFNKVIGVQLEINSSGEGYSTIKSDHFPYTRDVDLNYVQVPLMLKVNTGGSIARYYAMAGVQFGFLSSAKYSIDSAAYSDATTKRYNSSDFSVVIAMGLEINFIPKLYANLGIRGNYGLTDLNSAAYKKTDGNTSNNYWGGIELGVHYKIF